MTNSEIAKTLLFLAYDRVNCDSAKTIAESIEIISNFRECDDLLSLLRDVAAAYLPPAYKE